MSKKKSHPSTFSFSNISNFSLRFIGNFFVNAWDLLVWVFENRSVAVNGSNSFDAWCIRTFGAPLDPWIKYLSLAAIVLSIFLYTPALSYINTGLGMLICAKALRDTIRPPGH